VTGYRAALEKISNMYMNLPMRKLGLMLALSIFAVSCGLAPEEEVSVQLFLKQGEAAQPPAIQAYNDGTFAGKGELTKGWECNLGEKLASGCAIPGGFVLSGQKKSVIIGISTGKTESLPDGLVSGVTDGKTVWGDNGMAWSIDGHKKIWNEPVKVAKGDSFAIVDGCLMLVTRTNVSRIDPTTGKSIWTLDVSTGTIGFKASTRSYVFIEASGWIFRIVPRDGQYVFLSKYTKVAELFSSPDRFAIMADDKVVIFDQDFSNPILTMGSSNKKINQIWMSGESMLLLTDTGYHFGKLPTDLTQETKQTFKSFTYNAKDKKMTAFTQVIGVGGDFAIVQGNIVACIGPDVKKDIWSIVLPAPAKDDFLPRILSLTKSGLIVFFQNKASLWK
jgi:hypothetical protein